MNASTRRVAVVITARPSYARIKTVLSAIRDHPGLKLSIVAGASAVLDKYGNVSAVMEREEFDAIERVYMVLEGENPVTMAKTTGLGIIELATVFDNLRPDVVISVADRFETIATAIAAAYQNIPVAHVQGGEVTGSIDEKVRHAVTKLADVHFPSTVLSGERIRRMGERADRVFVTGCPSIDLAAAVRTTRSVPKDPFAAFGGVGQHLDLARPYLIVIQHPVTTEHRDGARQIRETLDAVTSTGLPALWFWPNVDAGADGVSKGIRQFRETSAASNLHFFKNMPPESFLGLLDKSACIVGNSSAGIRESSYFGVPAVDVGTRQAGREAASNVVHVGYDAEEIRDAIRRQIDHGPYPSSPLYGDGHAGNRIAEILATCPLTTEKKLAY